MGAIFLALTCYISYLGSQLCNALKTRPKDLVAVHYSTLIERPPNLKLKNIFLYLFDHRVALAVSRVIL